MVVRLEDDDLIALDEINQAVLPGDPPGPCPGNGVADCLGFPIPSKGSRNIASMSLLIRLSIVRSAVCQ